MLSHTGVRVSRIAFGVRRMCRRTTNAKLAINGEFRRAQQAEMSSYHHQSCFPPLSLTQQNDKWCELKKEDS